MSARGRRPTAVLLNGAIVALLALAALGCGGSDGDDETGSAPGETSAGPAQVADVSPAGVKTIQRARDEVAAYCRRVAAALGKGTAPTPAAFTRVNEALDKLVNLAAEQPEAATADGTTPRLALGDLAENLEGTNCDERLVARIDQALATLPAD